MNDKTRSLDKILIEKGLITPQQLTMALEYQCRLSSSQTMSLAEVLIAMEYVTEDQVQEALGEKPAAEDVLIQMLIKNGLIQQDQLQEAVEARQQNQMDKRLGTVLLEMGFASKEVIETALKRYYQKHHQTDQMPSYTEAPPSEQPPQVGPQAEPVQQKLPKVPPEQSKDEEEPEPLGHRLIRMGFITREELQDAIDYQQRLPRILHQPIGEILVVLGYINEEQLQEILSEQSPQKQLSLGEILVKMNVLQQWQLSHAMSLKEQAEHKGKKLGHLIVELGYARRPEIEEALKEYYARQQSRQEPSP